MEQKVHAGVSLIVGQTLELLGSCTIPGNQIVHIIFLLSYSYCCELFSLGHPQESVCCFLFYFLINQSDTMTVMNSGVLLLTSSFLSYSSSGKNKFCQIFKVNVRSSASKGQAT